MTKAPDSAASPTSSGWLHLTLFAMETIGTVILYWKGVPLYRLLSANPTAYGTHEKIRLSSLSAIALIQVGYWVRYRIGPVLPHLTSSPLGHIVVFSSRMVFVLPTAVFSFVFISQRLASEITAPNYVLIVTSLFSLFLYSLELQRWGNKFMRRKKRPGHSQKANREANMTTHETSPWGSSLDKLKEWDPKGAELLLRVGTNPWTSGVLPRKEVELISLAIHCSCTTLDEMGTRRHIRAALDAGATRDEVLLVLKCGVGVAVHSCSLGAPILLEEMKAAGMKAAGGPKPETPACDAMRAMGQWNTAWDPFYELSPAWTDQFLAFAVSAYKSGLFTPRFLELLSIALDASYTHMYAPGTRRHVKAALKAGATPEEIMVVLQLCVSMGIQACANGVLILAEELEHALEVQR